MSRDRRARRILSGGQWLEHFRGVRAQAAEFVNKVGPTLGPLLDEDFEAFKKTLRGAANMYSQEEDAIKEAVENLPAIRNRLYSFPRSDVRQVRKIHDLEVRALDAWLDALLLGTKWIGEQDNQPLEAAIFYRFAQAHKHWQRSAKEESAFWGY